LGGRLPDIGKIPAIASRFQGIGGKRTTLAEFEARHIGFRRKLGPHHLERWNVILSRRGTGRAGPGTRPSRSGRNAQSEEKHSPVAMDFPH
jgi:hypothetical protein